MTDEPEVNMSPLSQPVTRDGKTVQIHIYENGEGGWVLEVEDEYWNSTVWNDSFPTDRAALDEALKAIEEEGIGAMIGEPSVLSMRRNDEVNAPRSESSPTEPACGLCGKSGDLIRTECCNRWICDDEHLYVPFTYARNSCLRNHRQYTICAHHFAEDHEGSWKDCATCQADMKPELYVYFGTNEYNFEKLVNPPTFSPTYCAGCHQRIRLGTDGYTLSGGKYWCPECASKRRGRAQAGRKRRR